jgi:hypothetical protein
MLDDAHAFGSKISRKVMRIVPLCGCAVVMSSVKTALHYFAVPSRSSILQRLPLASDVLYFAAQSAIVFASLQREWLLQNGALLGSIQSTE